VTYLIEHIVTVTYSVSTFGTYISGRLDRERIGGCSHLPVVAENIGGCILLLVVARELGSWSFPQVVA
jgi:hypothetical protein